MTVLTVVDNSDVKVDVNADAVMAKISEYSFASIRERLLKEGLLHEGNVDTAITEYHKFMTLFALGHNQLAMCSALVDEVWHTHILFTRDYMRFCKEVFGRYVHHKPNVESDPIAEGGDVRFYEAYTQVFGDLDAIWEFEYDMVKCILSPPICQACQGCGYCGANYDEEDNKK